MSISRSRIGARHLAVAGLAAAALLTAALPAAPAVASPRSTGSSRVGADVPFTEYQAEDGRTTGAPVGPDRAYGTVAAESIGRRAVRLQGTGRYVEFRLRHAANAITVRASLPDTADGAGRDATLGVVVGGRRIAAVPLSSRYSWYYGLYPWSNTTADGGPRQAYDDGRVLLPRTLPAGTRVRLQVGTEDSSPSYTVDLADFERVAAPLRAPEGAVDVTAHGADPSGRTDSSDAIQAVLDAAKGTGRTVWLPRGTYRVTRHLIVDRVTLRGAGIWYSALSGKGVGVYGGYNPTPSSDVHLSDFAILGGTSDRIDSDQVNAIGGAMNDSTVTRMWLQHSKVGMWMDGPMHDLRVSRVRILDQTADGLNFHRGVTDSTVTDTFVRNTGDDGLAMWSDQDADERDVFRRNTVQAPILANATAVYGGSDNTVADNLLTDTVTEGGGVQVANRFGAVPLSGTTRVTGNTLLRTGSLGLYTHTGNGAIWFWAADAPITGAVLVDRNRILDSSYEAVQFTGLSITGATLSRNVIAGAGTFAVQLNAAGSATLRQNRATGLGAAAVYDCPTDQAFELRDRTGDRGLSSRVCGYPAPGPLRVDSIGETLQFRADAIGAVSEPQTITVTNPTTRPVRIASITATGAYTVEHDCGARLAAHASCAVRVVFAPTRTGDVGGALTVSDGSPAGRYQVYLHGAVARSVAGNLTAGRPVVATGTSPGCCTAEKAVDGDASTVWEGPADTFPASLTVDLGSTQTLGRLALSVPWSRTERFQVETSEDGTAFTTVLAPQDVAFEDASGDRVEVPLPAGTQGRYLRVTGSTNSAWNAVQIGELEAYVR